MKPSTFNTRILGGGLLGLLAGASFTVLVMGAPSHAFDPQPEPMTPTADGYERSAISL